MVYLIENNSAERTEQIRMLYESAFPPDERMPFDRVLQKRDSGVMRLLSVEGEGGELLGFARITELSPAEHDEMIAFLSQLTHCIAVSLMTCNASPSLEKYTGDSFRDLTRIAKINDEMWSELFLLNREPLLRQMDLFEKEFARLRKMLADGDRDGMREMMRTSTARRALFDKPTPNTETN